MRAAFKIDNMIFFYDNEPKKVATKYNVSDGPVFSYMENRIVF